MDGNGAGVATLQRLVHDNYERPAFALSRMDGQSRNFSVRSKEARQRGALVAWQSVRPYGGQALQSVEPVGLLLSLPK